MPAAKARPDRTTTADWSPHHCGDGYFRAQHRPCAGTPTTARRYHTTSGIICAREYPARCSSVSSHFERMDVEQHCTSEALVASVTCDLTAGEVPHQEGIDWCRSRASPRRARSSAPGTFSSIHCTFVPAKYASGISPVLSRMVLPRPSSLRRSTRCDVRRHCHTIALYTGFPVLRSHTSVVSR